MTDKELLAKYKAEFKSLELKALKTRGDLMRMSELQSLILNLEIEMARKWRRY